MSDDAAIGTHIRQAREHRGISQATLADRCGIKPSSLAAIERGDRNPGPATVRHITAELAYQHFTPDMLTAAIDRRYLGAQEAANLLGISHGHLANLRRGIRGITPDLIDRLITGLVLRVDDLLDLAAGSGDDTAAEAA